MAKLNTKHAYAIAKWVKKVPEEEGKYRLALRSDCRLLRAWYTHICGRSTTNGYKIVRDYRPISKKEKRMRQQYLVELLIGLLNWAYYHGYQLEAIAPEYRHALRLARIRAAAAQFDPDAKTYPNIDYIKGRK